MTQFDQYLKNENPQTDLLAVCLALGIDCDVVTESELHAMDTLLGNILAQQRANKKVELVKKASLDTFRGYCSGNPAASESVLWERAFVQGVKYAESR